MPAPNRILVIDDSRDAAYMMKILLSKIGYAVETATGGRQGIDAAKQSPPDIVFCDIGMPMVDGYEVARQLRADEATRRAFLVATTGYAQDDDKAKAIQSGFDRHLTKPINFATLKETLAAAATRSQADGPSGDGAPKPQ